MHAQKPQSVVVYSRLVKEQVIVVELAVFDSFLWLNRECLPGDIPRPLPSHKPATVLWGGKNRGS